MFCHPSPTSPWRPVALHVADGNRITAAVRAGRGPALVLIPGTWGNAHTRGPLLERLDTALTIVCVALAGQDDNWPPPQHPSIPMFSDHILALADHLGLNHFFVAGNSLGGMVALEMLRFGPSRIEGAISIEGWTHWAVLQNAFANDTTSTLTESQRRRLEEVRHQLLDRWDPALRARYNAIWQEWDGWEILRTTPLPVLEIWGDRSRPHPSREVMRIPDRPNIELAWIPNTSHNLLVEAPDRLAELMNPFVHRHAGASNPAARP